ncbi:MAG: glucose 1-dehydrogenase [Planctomycetota bacterium]|nr:glucose 1-dehydrogenase [Planctomycetota bacterium]
MADKRKMDGKRVLVSGSGTGIGREVALEFARQGAAVAVHYSHSARGAQEAVDQILSAGGRSAAFKANLESVQETRGMARQALAFLGGLDVLVNNAGITMNLPFEEVTPEQFDTLYHVNVRGMFFLTQAVLKALLEARGAVVNVTSVHGLRGYVEHSVYAGTKGAIIAFTRQLAVELAPRGIRVNAIAPGCVPVKNHFKDVPDADVPKAIADAGKTIPCGFAGTPVDIAKVAVFLASDDARFIVGQTIVADGGTTSWLAFGEQFKQPMMTRFGKGYVPGL